MRNSLQGAPTNKSPSTWTVQEVSSWATRQRLPEDVVAALGINQVDGLTLLTLTKEELRSELSIPSLSARRHLWELILALQAEVSFYDCSATLAKTEQSSATSNVARLPVADLSTSDKKRKSSSALTTPLDVDRQEQKRIYEQMQQERLDREYALSLMQNSVDANLKNDADSSSSDVFSPVDHEMSSVFVDLCKNVPDPVETDSRKPVRDPTVDLPMLDKCNICFETEVQGFYLACDHKQCSTCMAKLFRTAIKDSSLLPMTCCSLPIDMNVAFKLLEPEEAQLLQTRTLELETQNRMYCPRCNAFFNLDLVDSSETNVLSCECGVSLCLVCKTLDHPGISCDANQVEIARMEAGVLEFSKENGWKQCPKCSVMIELRSGCNHMTCLSCRHEFCFKCLKPWCKEAGMCPSGECPLWEEAQLLEEGERRVQQEENNLGAARQGVVPREQLHRAMRGLRTHENCKHRWVHRRGNFGDCAKCMFTLETYGMKCVSDCGYVVCFTCARHRLPRRGWR
eukprot:Nitzschia sp. Nitz4//scaffold247_size31676//22229//23767//NITZ4_007931-RA/size31676-processed-gene-0.20-mRNA-1//-1//CDS//3329543958//7264//frame0